MTEELPSDWHLAEALRRELPDWTEGQIAAEVSAVKARPYAFKATIAHASTLAEFIPEPVDPLLVMAREICAKVAEQVVEPEHAENFAEYYRNGDYDPTPEVQFAYDGLRKAAGGVE